MCFMVNEGCGGELERSEYLFFDNLRVPLILVLHPRALVLSQLLMNI